jgi:hypothetical protein
MKTDSYPQNAGYRTPNLQGTNANIVRFAVLLFVVFQALSILPVPLNCRVLLYLQGIGGKSTHNTHQYTRNSERRNSRSCDLTGTRCTPLPADPARIRAPLDDSWASHLARNSLCVECEWQGCTTEATVVDQIEQHLGNANLFWDVGSWQPL